MMTEDNLLKSTAQLAASSRQCLDAQCRAHGVGIKIDATGSASLKRCLMQFVCRAGQRRNGKGQPPRSRATSSVCISDSAGQQPKPDRLGELIPSRRYQTHIEEPSNTVNQPRWYREGMANRASTRNTRCMSSIDTLLMKNTCTPIVRSLAINNGALMCGLRLAVCTRILRQQAISHPQRKTTAYC
jgi:hypothetical protein